jgi:hypothetical protein
MKLQQAFNNINEWIKDIDPKEPFFFIARAATSI